MVFYDFQICGLLFRVEAARALTVPDNFRPFALNENAAAEPDLRLQILFGAPPANAVAAERFYWQEGEYIVRQEPGEAGEPIRLYIPESFADTFCRQGNWLLYLAPERLLQSFDRLILHASAVLYQGKAYLFSAPSGGGKSTHAALWQTHYGAKVLNGDKVVIHVTDGGCTAYGSPVAGSSGIYENEGAPVAAVFMLNKAAHNRLAPLTKRSALLALYSEAIKCAADPAFNTRLLDLLQMLLSAVPVLSLECLPEKGAVDCILSNLREG
ncbi:MAG: hypothetical protein IJW14_02860 [Oscillospiraceae bacterium]|nr:hypothetical protein [Oscillospiraceae bacterium]